MPWLEVTGEVVQLVTEMPMSLHWLPMCLIAPHRSVCKIKLCGDSCGHRLSLQRARLTSHRQLTLVSVSLKNEPKHRRTNIKSHQIQNTHTFSDIIVLRRNKNVCLLLIDALYFPFNLRNAHVYLIPRG